MPIEEEKKQIEVSSDMIALFLSEFAIQYGALRQGLEAGVLADVNKALTSMVSSLKIIHLDSVLPLVSAFDKGFKDLQAFPSDNQKQLLEIAGVLAVLTQTNPKDLYETAKSLIPKIEEGVQSLSKIFGQGASVKVQPEQKRENEVDKSLLNLFLTELDSQISILNQGLLLVESHKATSETFGNLMRASHSLKGAARVVELEPLVNLAHSMEDCFIQLEKQPDLVDSDVVDILFFTLDFFSSMSNVPKEFLSEHINKELPLIEQMVSSLQAISRGEKAERITVGASKERGVKDAIPSIHEDRILRVGSKRLNSLMGLAGESLVESLWLQPFGESLTNLKHTHSEIALNVELIRETLKNEDVNERVNSLLSNLQHNVNICQQNLDHRLSDLEMFIRRHASLSERLYGEVIDIRMRPFSDGVHGFPRIVRDLGRQLGKKVRLEIIGESTPVDRDILEKLETPLMHLLRNSVDHGIEPPEVRKELGKPEEGVVTLEAMHRSGMLFITVTDDGKGIDVDKIKEKVVQDKIVNPGMIGNLSDSELLDFLYLPGFTTSSDVTEISGRGMGLNIVQKMIQEVGGTIRTSTTKGHHLSFHLQLPLTLSVIRALLVEIGGEPYAFPLARIDRSVLLPKSEIEIIENRQYFQIEDKNVGLVQAAQILKLKEIPLASLDLPIIVLTDRVNYYGVLVDKFVGEKDLVVQDIDPLLGKMPGISSGAFMEDGSPLLIIDVEDMLRSIDNLLYGSPLKTVESKAADLQNKKTKKILVVDDSITVREVEYRLLQNRGYEVQTAVDGVDGWNAVRIGKFDMIITDVDMPRMNGIDLVKAIKQDRKLKDMPVMIVSYKDREEDREQGLAAGADYYLTKGSFHDETLVDAVVNLIGPPQEQERLE